MANHFVMVDWAALWIDIVGGLLIAGALTAWVPDSWWQAVFLEGHGTLTNVWGPVVAPALEMMSRPLAALAAVAAR